MTKQFTIFVASAALSLPPVAAFATTATGLSSFDAVEEPLVKFYPATGKFVPDDFVNITDQGGGTFRMFDRYNAEWWDGDRDTTNRDRQRAEVKGLGPHQFNGDTFEYTTTWRLSPGFRGTAGFCHIFQLKAVNGDDGAPLVTMSIHDDQVSVEANPAGPKIIAREFSWRPNTWLAIRLRIKTSRDHDGALLVSVNGDPFQGRTGIELSRPDASEYRPKWGLYRKATVRAPMGDDFVEHQHITARQVGAPAIENAALEIEARTLVQTTSPQKTLAGLLAQSVSPARDFAIGSIAALWSETDPVAAMAWAETLPTGALRVDCLNRVFCRWADRDVTAAAKWLRAHAPDATLDPLVWFFVTDTTYRYVNRPVAFDAAPLIQDQDRRGKAFEHIVGIWARTDRTAASDFVRRTPALTDRQKQTILHQIGGSAH